MCCLENKNWVLGHNADLTAKVKNSQQNVDKKGKIGIIGKINIYLGHGDDSSDTKPKTGSRKKN